VREAVDLADLEAQRKDISLHLDLDEKLPPVLMDAIQIEQVVLNLVRNAIEAIDLARRPARDVTIRTSLDARGDVEVSVRDTGPGWPAEDTERLFEAFYSTKPGGMGLGLSISRSIVEEHRGQLRALRNPGGGAIFRFSVPTAGAGDAER
jgi:two-component system sensor histidine kinase TtrS